MLEKIKQVKVSPMSISRAKGKLTIDGTPDEDAWKAADAVDLAYVFPQITPLKDKPVTAARLLWDDENLYVSYVVPDADLTGNPGIDANDNTFLYDCVELFVMPDLDLPAYWEINLTYKNEVVDRLIFKKPHGWFGLPLTEEGIAGMKTAVKKTDAGYAAEIAVPWRSLPGLKNGVKAGDRIWALVAWGDVNGKVDWGSMKYYSQVPTVAGFNSVWEFQEWRLK
jgi:hypothetical protein